MATTTQKKKVLFLITKSNWGEKWDGTHFARLAQQFCEYLEQNGEQVDSVCKTGRLRDDPTIIAP